MAKRNVAYVKPEEPKFLRDLKEQAGYSDSNPKFDKLQNGPEDFASDEESEQPQVVVLKPGDLTAEEAAKEQEKIELEKSEAKADLNQKVIFNTNRTKSKWESGERKRTSNSDNKNGSKKKAKDSERKGTLSFQLDEEEDEDT